MRFKEIFIISKGTKVIIAITFSVSLTAVIFAFFYYRSINNSEDPRIRKAREYLYEFDNYSGSSYSFESFPLLDSASSIFRSFPDYNSSYELGVIYNNKCSSLLLMAIYDSTINDMEKRKLLSLSMRFCDSSILIYSKWIDEWDNLSPSSIAQKIEPFMNSSDNAFKGYSFKKIFSRRIKNITKAQIETPRRLSVSLTNKGTIYRHMIRPDSSLICYNQALQIWKDNRIAKSNLNVLLGGDPLKPSLIESLFPPDKNKR